MRNMDNIADWMLALLYIAFVTGVIGYSYYEIKNRKKRK